MSKRYCKNIVIDESFIKDAVYCFLKNKWGKEKIVRYLRTKSGCDFSYQEFKEVVKNRSNDQECAEIVERTIDMIVDEIYQEISSGDIELRKIKYRQIEDGMTNKVRTIGSESIKHQIYDYIAVNGLMEMFNKKLGKYQCASLPGKGQAYGRKWLEYWIRKDGKIKYYQKFDVQKAYQSIDLNLVKKLLRKDVKNDTLMYIIDKLLDMFDNGLMIGSYLSAYLCNYVMSYAYHFIEDNCYYIRRGKRIRMVRYQLWYMDDGVIIGNSKKGVKMAFRAIKKFMAGELGLTLKLCKICKVDDEPIDMMGFVFRRRKTTIRAKIFLKARNLYLRMIRQKRISLQKARRAMSYYGWFKSTDSLPFKINLGLKYLIKKCKRIISYHSKGGYYAKNRIAY